jgi:L,D-peptidoglycan transpeptidase YkuD (ErfK/YbiS/YcfS/YnhG family)
MDLIVSADGVARWHGLAMRCALGRGGIAAEKREGDGATPAGSFALRRVLYRPDRLAPPPSGLAVAPIAPDDGWCDDPGDPSYNRPVKLPYAARHERMWREDRLYDLVVVLGHNDEPVLPGAGSAVFLHVAPPDGGATAGCVGLAMDDLLRVVREARPGDRIIIQAPPAGRPGD